MVSVLSKGTNKVIVGEGTGEQSKDGTERVFKSYKLDKILKGKAELINFDYEFSN